MRLAKHTSIVCDARLHGLLGGFDGGFDGIELCLMPCLALCLALDGRLQRLDGSSSLELQQHHL